MINEEEKVEMLRQLKNAVQTAMNGHETLIDKNSKLTVYTAAVILMGVLGANAYVTSLIWDLKLKQAEATAAIAVNSFESKANTSRFEHLRESLTEHQLHHPGPTQP